MHKEASQPWLKLGTEKKGRMGKNDKIYMTSADDKLGTWNMEVK